MFKSLWGITALIVVTAFLFWAVYTNVQQLLSFAAALVINAVMVLVLWIVDNFVLHNFDTLTELKNGNTAVGLALVAYAILSAGATIAGFAIFR